LDILFAFTCWASEEAFALAVIAVFFSDFAIASATGTFHLTASFAMLAKMLHGAVTPCWLFSSSYAYIKYFMLE